MVHALFSLLYRRYDRIYSVPASGKTQVIYRVRRMISLAGRFNCFISATVNNNRRFSFTHFHFLDAPMANFVSTTVNNNRRFSFTHFHFLDTSTAKTRGILEKFDCSHNPYSQRACQKPSTQSLSVEVLLTFLCNVARSIDTRIDERICFCAI